MLDSIRQIIDSFNPIKPWSVEDIIAMQDLNLGVVSTKDNYLWVALLNESPKGQFKEVVGAGYNRAPLAMNNSYWIRSAGRIMNNREINFGMAHGSWGTINYFAIMSAKVGGFVLLFGSLCSEHRIQTFDIVKILPYDLEIKETKVCGMYLNG